MVHDSIVKLSRTIACAKAQNLLCPGFINGAKIPRKKHYMNPLEQNTTRCCSGTPNPTSETSIRMLFNKINRKSDATTNKVTVVGTGEIGLATVFALLAKNIAKEICIIDVDDKKLKGEQLDLQYCSTFLKDPNSKITVSKDHSASAYSRINVITVGIDRERAESYSTFISRNAGIIQAVIPPLVKYNPGAIFLVASEPVDIMTYLTWKISGLPKSQVIGTGTNLDTARFRYLLSDRLKVSPRSCQAFIIGGQGENSVPVWSGVTIAGVRLADLNPDIGTERDVENWQGIHDTVVKSEQLIRDLKGYNCWSPALSIVDICEAILTNSNTVRPLSIFAKGEHFIRNEIFLSLPCIVGLAGVSEIVRQPLTENETYLLRKYSDVIADFQNSNQLVI